MAKAHIHAKQMKEWMQFKNDFLRKVIEHEQAKIK